MDFDEVDNFRTIETRFSSQRSGLRSRSISRALPGGLGETACSSAGMCKIKSLVANKCVIIYRRAAVVGRLVGLEVQLWRGSISKSGIAVYILCAPGQVEMLCNWRTKGSMLRWRFRRKSCCLRGYWISCARHMSWAWWCHCFAGVLFRVDFYIIGTDLCVSRRLHTICGEMRIAVFASDLRFPGAMDFMRSSCLGLMAQAFLPSIRFTRKSSLKRSSCGSL